MESSIHETDSTPERSITPEEKVVLKSHREVDLETSSEPVPEAPPESVPWAEPINNPEIVDPLPEKALEPIEWSESRATIAWQKNLLPFTATIFALLLCFVIAGSVWQVNEVQHRIKPPTFVDLDAAFKISGGQPLTSAQSVEMVRWKSLALLESGVQQKRYELANSAIMGRLWLTYCGFLTGMSLTFLGAIFVLSKISERPTNISIRTSSGVTTADNDAGVGLSLASASPGIILVVLGTILLGLTLAIKSEIQLEDVPTYVTTWNDQAFPDLDRDNPGVPAAGTPVSGATPTKDTGRPDPLANALSGP